MSPDWCKHSIERNLNRRTTKFLIAMDQTKKHVFGWLLATRPKCSKHKYGKFYELKVACVNPAIKDNNAFRYLMSYFLLDVKVNHPKYDVILQVLNNNYIHGDTFGSKSIDSKEYKQYKHDARMCEIATDTGTVGAVGAVGAVDAIGAVGAVGAVGAWLGGGNASKHTSILESMEDFTELMFQSERQAQQKQQLRQSKRLCPLPPFKKEFLEQAEAAERLVCNYNRWGFELQNTKKNQSCFGSGPHMDIMVCPLTKFNKDLFKIRIVQLVKRERKRLKINRDLKNRCLDPNKYGTEFVEKKDALLK